MTRIATVAAALAMLAAACSGRVSGDDAGGGAVGGGGGSGGGAGGATGGGGVGMTGLDRSKPISSVTEAEKNTLCDWFAPMVGGYGTTHPCAQAFITAPPDKATCIAEFPVCAVTVGAFADCVAVIVAAQNTCTDASLAAAVANPACSSSGPGNCFN